MKVLYVACNPAGAGNLMLENEITELQSLFRSVPGEPVEFVLYPRKPVEELPLAIQREKPDVLHISAHGDSERLQLANADEMSVAITGKMLKAFLNTTPPPRLVYLNACRSRDIACELVDLVPMAIGTSAPISNRSARAAAVLFYSRLLEGASVHTAYEGAKASIEALQRAEATAEIFHGEEVDPKAEYLHQALCVIARFKDGDDTPSRDGFFDVELGVTGCPANTAQVVVFTDDRSFIELEEGDDIKDEAFLAGELCRVALETPVRSTIWMADELTIFGDYRIFAACVTAAGKVFTATSTLCESIEAFHRLREQFGGIRGIPQTTQTAMRRLRSMDGSGFDFHGLKRREVRKHAGAVPPSDGAAPAEKRRAPTGRRKMPVPAIRHLKK